MIENVTDRPHPDGMPLRVLVVEDEALVAFEIETVLTNVGHQVVGLADNLEEAIEFVATAHPNLALVDVRLARGGNGLHVAEALKARGIPSLLATGNCPREAAKDIALGCLHKPFNDRTLLAAIDAVCAVLKGHRPTYIPPSLHFY